MTIDQACDVIISSSLPSTEKWLLCLMWRNGLRVSEVANPNKIKIINAKSCSVWQWKTGSYRSASIFDLQDETKRIILAGGLIYWKRNRFYYYRVLRRMGLYEFMPTRRYQRVTHASRYIVAQGVYDATSDMSQVAASLGHRSTRSSEYYVKKKRNGADIIQGVPATASGSINDLIMTKKGVVYVKKK